MKIRNCLAAASLVVLAAPLAIAVVSALGISALAASDLEQPAAKETLKSLLTAYFGAISIGFFGFFLAGICLDGRGMRNPWYLRSLWTLGVLWLFYFPVGSIFGACLLVYLASKHLAECAGNRNASGRRKGN